MPGMNKNSAQSPYKSNQVVDEVNNLPVELTDTYTSCNMFTSLEEGKFEHIDHKIDITAQVETLSKASSSFTQSVVNMTGMIIGLGQLSAPYGLENGGWTSIFLLVGLGVMCAYCACLLGKCLEKNPNSRSYIEIGQAAFGDKGKTIATIFVYMNIFMSLVSYTISLHDNLNTVLNPGFTHAHRHMHSHSHSGLPKSYVLTVLAVLVALPTLWLKNLSAISFLSTAGILMSLAIFMAVIGTAVFGLVEANQYIPILHLDNIPHISGLYIFSYGGHFVFPNLYKDMKDPSKFSKVTMVSFTAAICYYTVMAFTGAKMFGQNINSQITLSMPKDLISTKIALWATILVPLTKYALQFTPFAIQIEQNLPSYLKSRTKVFIRGSIGSILLLAILVLALSVPYFQYVLSLTGSIVSVTLGVILPCIFYTKICLTPLSKPLLFSLNVFIVAIGATLSIFGTFSASKSLVHIFRTTHRHPVWGN